MYAQHAPHRILVPLDGSDLGTVTFPHLRALACVETEILLLRVIPPDPLPITDSVGTPVQSVADIRRHNLETCRAYLQAVATPLRDVTPRFEKLIRVGVPADEILKVAHEREVDLILMPTHGRGGLGKLALGSVASRISQAASVPVMLVHARHGELPLTADAVARYRRIIVPLDGSERAREAIPVAVDLARRQNLPVHLVRVVPTREELFASRDTVASGTHYQRLLFATSLDSRSERDDAYYEGYVNSLSDALHAEAARLRPYAVDASAELLIGPTVPSILDLAGTADIIVMTSHGEGGVRHWLMGSVAEKIVSMAMSPLVLVPVPERRELTDPDRAQGTEQAANSAA